MSVYVGHGAAVNPLLAGDELEQVIHDQVGRYPTAGMLGGLTVGAPYFLYLLYRHRH